MRYCDAKLDSINDIQIGSYLKCPKGIPPMGKRPDVYVQNIDNIGSGTVYAKFESGDTYSEKPATVVLLLINEGNTCYVAGTPS